MFMGYYPRKNGYLKVLRIPRIDIIVVSISGGLLAVNGQISLELTTCL